ncbi:glycosyltransferase, partial [Phormidium pseudopriestleyi FRX01]
MSLPSISVIIPTYNREKVLRDTLADVLQQDYPDFEVLV